MLRRFVYGIPKGQPRPRAFARKMGDRVVARVYESGSAEAWKGAVALAFRGAVSVPLGGPISMQIDLLFPRPARLMRKKDPDGLIPCESKPDADNAAKAVMDSAQSIGLFRDDAQVVELQVRKWFHAKDGVPGAIVRVEEWGESIVPAILAQEVERLTRFPHEQPTVRDAADFIAGPGATIEEYDGPTTERSRMFGAEP